MTVLVTGGTGWIGSFVVRELAKTGEEIIAFDAVGDGSRFQGIPHLRILRGDILDFPGLYETVRRHRVDRIIHLAGIIQADSARNPRLMQKVNCEGAVNVMEVARLAEIRRMVFSSTTVVYGETTCASVDEDYPCNPANPYAASKVLGEALLKQYHRLHGLDFAAVRFAHVFGPEKLKGTPVFKDLFEVPARGETYALPIGGDHKFNWSYVKDCASATVAACFAPLQDLRIFNICEGARHSPRDIADMIASQVVPGATFDIGPGQLQGHPAESLVEVGRAEKVLGWKPQYPMLQACQDYVASMPRAK